MQRFDASFSDPGQLPERMGSVARNFSIRPACAGPFTSTLSAARLGDVAVFDISMTEAEVLSPDELGYYSINLPRSIPLRAKVDGQVEAFSKEELYIVRPDERLDIRFPKHTGCFVINVFKKQLVEYAAKLDGRVSDKLYHLSSRVMLTNPAGYAFRRYVDFLWSEVQRNSPVLESKLVTAEWESALIAALLVAAGQEDADANEVLRAAPVGRAVDFIMEHLGTSLSVAAIAAAAGVHARTLQRAFNTRFGFSVMAFVEECRLRRVHQQLLAADPHAVTVTEVAMANGFWHLGRFSGLYRSRFDESPVKTLRRG
jgi:AraC-like DNA-binding protein